MNPAELELLKEAKELCASTLEEKDRVGRNAFADVLSTFPHELQDVTFILYDKTTRIIGAEKVLSALPITLNSAEEELALQEDITDNLIDIVNYGLIALMFRLRGHHGET